MESNGFRSEKRTIFQRVQVDEPVQQFDEVAKMINQFSRDELMNVVFIAASNNPRIIEDIRRIYLLRHDYAASSPPPRVSRDCLPTIIEYYYISHGDGKCAIPLKIDQPPPIDARTLIHTVYLEEDAFSVDGKAKRSCHDDPKNQDFLQSLKVGELPKEFLLKDGIIRHHGLVVVNQICEYPSHVPDGGRVRFLSF